MPALVLWIGRLLLSVGGQVAISVLVSLGLGFAGSKVVSSLGLGEAIRTVMGQTGPLWDYVGFFGVDVAMTIVLSAWAGRMVADAARVHLVRRMS